MKMISSICFSCSIISDSTTAASNNYQQLQQSTDNNGDELDVNNTNDKSNNRSSDGFIQVTDDVILVNNLTEDRIIEENRLIQQLNRYTYLFFD